jgi:hypothetical protein
MVLFLFHFKKEVFMRTASKPHPNQVLAKPTKEASYALIDELRLTDYSGKKFISKVAIKHIHLSDTVWNFTSLNN